MKTHAISRQCLALVICLLVTLPAGLTALASIRVDGSQFQPGSSGLSAPKFQKRANGEAVPTRMVMTTGQAVMAYGSLREDGDNVVAFRIGLGYEYNVLKYSYDLGCACPCFADPECDGVTNVLDVVRAINVAFRGAAMGQHENCPRWLTDVDCNGVTNVLDVTTLVDITFHDADPATVLCSPCAQ